MPAAAAAAAAAPTARPAGAVGVADTAASPRSKICGDAADAAVPPPGMGGVPAAPLRRQRAMAARWHGRGPVPRRPLSGMVSAEKARGCREAQKDPRGSTLPRLPSMPRGLDGTPRRDTAEPEAEGAEQRKHGGADGKAAAQARPAQRRAARRKAAREDGSASSHQRPPRTGSDPQAGCRETSEEEQLPPASRYPATGRNPPQTVKRTRNAEQWHADHLEP